MSRYDNDPFIVELRRNPAVANYPQYVDLLIAVKEESERLGLPDSWEYVAELLSAWHAQMTGNGLSRSRRSIILDTNLTIEEMAAQCHFHEVHEDITSELFPNKNLGTFGTNVSFVDNQGFQNVRQLMAYLTGNKLVACSIFHLLALVATDLLLPLQYNVISLGSGVNANNGTLVPCTGATDDYKTALKLVHVESCFDPSVIHYFMVQPM